MSKSISLMPLTKELVSAMIMMQVILACYLLALDLQTALLITAVFGLPVTLLCALLLRKEQGHHHTKMTIVMLAVSGLGMMLGCNADLGRTGLLSLLSMCQSTPLTLLSGPGTVWQKIQLTPWTYIGMFIGGNLAMLSVKELRPGADLSLQKTFYLYTICNLGMLIGMLGGEAMATQIVNDINQFIAAALMIALMLTGMSLGMVATLAVGNNQRTVTAL